jgi:signal transduction histidine kinase
MATTQRSRMAAIEQSQVRGTVIEAMLVSLPFAARQRLFASLANHELRTPMHREQLKVE